MQDPILFKAYLSVLSLTGALMCFFGYRLFKVVIGLFGAVAGAAIAAQLGFELSGGNQVAGVLAAAGGAVVGAVLLIALYFVGVFVIGAGLGAVVAAVLTGGSGPGVRAVVTAVLAAACGALAVVVQRYIIIAATAFNGSALVVAGLWVLLLQLPARLVPRYQPSSVAYAFLLTAWLALGALGLYVQLCRERRLDKAAAESEVAEPGPDS